MKKNIFFALFSAMLLMTACQQHEIDRPVDLGDGFTLLGYTDAQTKTAFGTPDEDENTIPFLWSEGDKIWSNGAQSDPASVSNDGATALFSFTSGSMANQVYYNMTGTSATGAHVKSEQTIGNLGANGDFGYATVNEGSFTLNHATAYLWFNVTSDVANATLESINIDVYEANIAGKATWNGTSFEDLTEASNSVTLTVGETLSSTNENVWAMVIFPSALTGAKVTYKLTVGGQTKYFEQELTAAKTLNGGETARISANITSEGLYELRVLTFEDADAKFPGYVLDYCSAEINTWSDLIDETQYSGDILYSFMQSEGDYYRWIDQNNTFLAHHLPYNYDMYWYAGGGHAISNYATGDYITYGNYQYQLTIYKPNAGDEVVSEGGGHNGSDNFCVHFGYMDGSPYNQTAELPSIYFGDGNPRVIDHMWVANTVYALNCFSNGNSLTEAIQEGDKVYVTATGYDKNDEKTGECTIYLVNGPDNIVDKWVKWDLSSLGEVSRVDFNVLGTSDNGYGFSQPAYFAYDDVAVRFPIQ